MDIFKWLFSQLKMKPVYKILLVLGILAGLMWGTLKQVPEVNGKVDNHEKRITIIETQVPEIKEDLKEIKADIKTLLRRSRRREE